MQQGGRPSPFDRNMGTKMAAKCVEWLCEQAQMNLKEDGSIPFLPPSTFLFRVYVWICLCCRFSVNLRSELSRLARNHQAIEHVQSRARTQRTDRLHVRNSQHLLETPRKYANPKTNQHDYEMIA